MSNEQLKFWITCPDCQKPFGVEPRFILQYLNRVMDAKMSGEPREEETETGGETASAREGTRATPPTLPPSRQAPKTPYRNYRKGSYGTPALPAGRREWRR